MKVFCLPYAGGTAVVFKEWKSYFRSEIDLVGIEYAGHGRRSGEPLYNDVNEAINDVYNIISAEIVDGLPYAIYGHSMGAMLAFEVAQKIRDNNLPMPVHIFFSGRFAPHRKPGREKVYHTMPDEEFQKEIVNLGGTPTEFFEYPELMEYLLPILKNDFKISETAYRDPEIKPFDLPITVFVGKEEEELEAEDVHGWMYHTNQTCVVYYFNGGHFFIKNEIETISDVMQRTLVPERKTHKILR